MRELRVRIRLGLPSFPDGLNELDGTLIAGIQFESLLKLSDGFIEFLLAGKGDAKVEVGIGVFRPEVDYCQEGRLGFGEIPLEPQYNAESIISLPVGGAEPNRFTEIPDGLATPVLSLKDISAEEANAGIIFMEALSSRKLRQGFVELSLGGIDLS